MKRRLPSFKIGLLAVLTVVAGCGSAFAQDSGSARPDDFSAFRIISDRNIFDPNRRPRVASGPVPTIVDSFSLAGTMDYARGKFAVFDGTSSDYHKVLEPGGRIAGYTVSEIGRDTVKLVSGTNTLELRVGTQMRRDDNGRWSAGEPAETGDYSYASNSSRSDSGRRRFNSESRRTGSRANSPTAIPSPASAAPDASSGGAPETDVAPAPASDGAADANDPVARMMARRRQETSGAQNGNDNRNPNQ
jgi:hypothetical protein